MDVSFGLFSIYPSLVKRNYTGYGNNLQLLWCWNLHLFWRHALRDSESHYTYELSLTSTLCDMKKTVMRLLKVRNNRTCPVCGQQMTRIRRKALDRLISRIIPVIRCCCCGKSYRVLADNNEMRTFTMFWCSLLPLV